MLGFTIYNKPDREALDKAQKEQYTKDSIAKISKQNAAIKSPPTNTSSTEGDSIESDSLALAKKIAQYGPFAQSIKDSAVADIHVETDLFDVVVEAKGGAIRSVELKNFKTWDKHPLQLIASDSNVFNFNIPVGQLIVPTSALTFEATKNNYKVSGKDSISIQLVAKGDGGQSIVYDYTFHGNEYTIGYNVNFQGITAPGATMSPIALTWNQLARRQEKNLSNERNNTTIYYQDIENEVDKINPLSAEKYTTEKAINWIGFKQQFFTSVLISSSPFQTGASLETRNSDKDSLTKSMHADLIVNPSKGANPSIHFNWYFGPTHYATLQKSGFDLQKQIPLGWGIFGWVNKLIVIPAFNFLGQFNLGYGLVILLLTLYIKLLLLVFQFRSYMSQAKMRVLKPEMDELNDKFKDEDPLKKQQAVMELYRTAGVNPLGGCLPMLFQIPILFALFNFFPNAIELRQQGFLWADDLSTYDSIVNLPFTIPFYGNHVSLFALMMTVSTIIYTRMNNQLSAGSSQMMPQLKWMMYLMPVIFLFVLNSYAAGLNYYYFLANIITFAQQFAFRKLVDDQKIHAQIQENKKKPKKAKASSFQQRLEEMAKTRSQGK